MLWLWVQSISEWRHTCGQTAARGRVCGERGGGGPLRSRVTSTCYPAQAHGAAIPPTRWFKQEPRKDTYSLCSGPGWTGRGPTSLWHGEGVGCFEEKVGHCLEVYSCDIAPQGHRGQGRKLLGQPTATSALRTGRTQRRVQGKEMKRTEKCLPEHVQCLRNQVWGFNTSPLLILAAAQSHQYCSVDNRTTMTPTPRAPFKSAAYLFSVACCPMDVQVKYGRKFWCFKEKKPKNRNTVWRDPLRV